jgi:FlaA1/EpsC-like NDP-sugar epimerase
MEFLNNKTILVTGGTGSLGIRIVKSLLENCATCKVIVFSRDELKQALIIDKFKTFFISGKLQAIIGDVRDVESIKSATQEVDIVIHTAALKHVPITESNPQECVKTNIQGAVNLIEAARYNQVKHVIALSSDKAANPESVYGASKLISDKLFLHANSTSKTKYTIVRFGNILGSRGSVLPLFLEQVKQKSFTVTDPHMTRFSITIEEAVEVIKYALKNSCGGEMIIPKSPSFKIVDLADVIDPTAKKEYVGVRVGEKLHEDMITSDEARFVFENDKYFIVIPNNSKTIINHWELINPLKQVEENFHLSSDKNVFLNKEELKKHIENYIEQKIEL